jgi:TPR repeat protein
MARSTKTLDLKYESACKLFYGEGRRKNRSVALTHMQELANVGHVPATHALGLALLFGMGRKKSPQKGFALLEKAAKKGLPDACFRVGCCYEEGIGVRKDLEKAILWHKAATRHGQSDSMFNLGVLCEERARNANRKTRWLSEARRWYSLAAKRGNTEAATNLGLHLMEMANRPSELKMAERYLLAGAKKHDALAAFNLGILYDGQSRLANPKAARKWYGIAARKGVVKAQHNLGFMLVNGEGGPKNMGSGVRWLKAARRQGDRKSERVLRSL